jgi:hypothetical protein
MSRSNGRESGLAASPTLLLEGIQRPASSSSRLPSGSAYQTKRQAWLLAFDTDP